MGMRSSVTYRSLALGLGGLGVLAALVHCGGTLSIGSDEQPAKVSSDAGAAAPIDSGSGGDARSDSAIVAVDAGPGPGPALGVVLCQWGMPDAGVVPTGVPTESYARECTVTSDCAVATHLADCCGSVVALGVRANEASRFGAVGGICGAEFATCDCVGRAPRAEDGQFSAFSDAHDIGVACTAGRCQSHIASFACGNLQCDSKTEFCEVFPPGIAFPDGGTPPSSYACSPVPTGCMLPTTCACVTNATANVQSCSDAGGRITVTHFGI